MQKFQRLLLVLKRSYICCYINFGSRKKPSLKKTPDLKINTIPDLNVTTLNQPKPNPDHSWEAFFQGDFFLTLLISWLYL